MKLRYTITGVILLLVTVVISSLAILLSHNSACGPPPSFPDDAMLMKAVVYRCYGAPDVLEVEHVEKPVIRRMTVIDLR